MAEPEKIVYEFDPVSNVKDETGYWRLVNASSQSCKVSGVLTPEPKGPSLLLLPLAAIGLIGMAVMTGEEKKGKRGK